MLLLNCIHLELERVLVPLPELYSHCVPKDGARTPETCEGGVCEVAVVHISLKYARSAGIHNCCSQTLTTSYPGYFASECWSYEAREETKDSSAPNQHRYVLTSSTRERSA
jgi:hypothetical protein